MNRNLNCAFPKIARIWVLHAGNKETQNLRLKLAELESSKMNLEKELANFKLNSEQDQNASRQRISILNQTIEVNIVLRNLNYII